MCNYGFAIALKGCWMSFWLNICYSLKQMSTLLFQENNPPSPPDYQNVSTYSICRETNQYPPESYRNDSKSEDNTLKNGIRAPTLRYSGDERLWKATEACGWENISSVTGHLMSQLFFWLILFSTRGTMQCCQSSLSTYCIMPPHQKTPQNCIFLLSSQKQGTCCAGQRAQQAQGAQTQHHLGQGFGAALQGPAGNSLQQGHHQGTSLAPHLNRGLSPTLFHASSTPGTPSSAVFT